MNMDFHNVSSPCFVVDEAALQANMDILAAVRRRAECRIILALKGFAMFGVFPLMRKALDGTTASSLNEARLGREEFGGEVHVCAPAYRDDEFDELLELADHITFNSLSQWEHFRPRVEGYGRLHAVPPAADRDREPLKCGLRINPEHSEVKTALYDPCARFSRLGVTAGQFAGRDLSGITGLHFHTLCELNADSLERTLDAVEAKFGDALRRVQWVNFGGGHHITRADYDVEKLCALITGFKERYGVAVILEPGEAAALNAGVLVASVLDIVHNDIDIAILDTSAAAHMPDVLEMPYRPQIVGAGQPGKHPHTYRLGGMTCLAGDIIGDYSFPGPLEIGQRLVFLDMAHYSMVKTNNFNGVNLPAIAIRRMETGKIEVVRQFGYEDYRNRLG